MQIIVSIKHLLMKILDSELCVPALVSKCYDPNMLINYPNPSFLGFIV